MPRGPARVPNEILKARGSWLATARDKAGAVSAPVAVPTPPEKLMARPEALAAWQHMTKRLLELGCIAELDLHALSSYCFAWADYWDATDWLAENGDTVETENGPKLHPKVKVQQLAWDKVFRLGAQFGWTPTARARLTSAGKIETSMTVGKKRFFAG